MKKATTIIIALFALTTVFVAAPSDAEAQQRQVHVKKKRVVKKRTTTSRHSDRRPSRVRHRHHRSGVRVDLRLGSSRYRRHTHYRHRPHYYHHHDHTVVYQRPTQVIVVEADPAFIMPDLDCPIRTEEKRSGLQQWCATPFGNKHGVYRRWYDDGRLAAEGEYAYDQKDGVWTEWHPNGAIREEGEYLDGKRSGTWVTWGADGEELVVIDY